MTKKRSIKISIPEPIYYALRESGKEPGRSVEQMAEGVLVNAVLEIYKDAIKRAATAQPDFQLWSKEHEN